MGWKGDEYFFDGSTLRVTKNLLDQAVFEAKDKRRFVDRYEQTLWHKDKKLSDTDKKFLADYYEENKGKVKGHRVAVADVVRLSASKAVEKWRSSATEAWKEVSAEERNILKKYANMLLKKMKDEPFPEKDKEILKKHAKGFISFLKGLGK